MQGIGKGLIFTGIILIIAGSLFLVFSKLNIPFGKLPGDITYTRKNVTVFAPITTMIIVSIVLTVVLNIIGRWMK
ncbi:MAG: DUF2905 domain-containing protein [Aminobacterium sp.]|jgi:hypothetical protein|uniref:DUF2905 domain-containing protein n=1 Tax=unclassified Aminobacterium TaxID=2685012 RepID=UPI001BD1A30F|nr:MULTISPECIES: DUF2905 domain-containing protein [unclassified Aminobacterium]MDD2207018.1 DUF2905 domain-containing protein [Aminobacterium sp.]MDD3425653.1 DUF2905 domain-containing protein [Aminobacterium sp.]MDD3707988.1 DUF2905 domain-containing protein [Aminobacterium sp.]MDD4228953.1 DUF2905 domain-containing protein [Aminobacterium sp.]MDD4551895.1 DUF2905 domain-containing protein [Aminobacterium sp.]